MKKEEYICRYGEEAYEKELQKNRERWKQHPERRKPEEAEERNRNWYNQNRGEVLKRMREKRKQEPEVYRVRDKQWRDGHLEEARESVRVWNLNNPEEVKANSLEASRKGGKYYEKRLEYRRTGLQGQRNKIRSAHRKQYYPYKKVIAPDSQLHHEWIPNTADFRGVALVEKNQHMHGYIDVIQILEGEITLLTEEEIKKRG